MVVGSLSFLFFSFGLAALLFLVDMVKVGDMGKQTLEDDLVGAAAAVGELDC